MFSQTDVDAMSKQPLLRSATLVKLVEKLTSREYSGICTRSPCDTPHAHNAPPPEHNLANKFMCTYHTFASAEVLLELLIVRYSLPATAEELKDAAFVEEVLHPHQMRCARPALLGAVCFHLMLPQCATRGPDVARVLLCRLH